MFNQLLITNNTVFALSDLESKSLKIEKLWWPFEKYTTSSCPKYWNKFLNIAYSLTSFWLRLRRLCLMKSFFQMEQLCIQVLDLFSQILHIVWRRPWKASMTWLKKIENLDISLFIVSNFPFLSNAFYNWQKITLLFSVTFIILTSFGRHFHETSYLR